MELLQKILVMRITLIIQISIVDIFFINTFIGMAIISFANKKKETKPQI